MELDLHAEEEDMEKTLNQASQAVQGAEQLRLDGWPEIEHKRPRGSADELEILLSQLHRDPSLPVTRARLAELTGFEDRKVRELIRKAIFERHIPVVSDNYRGYWIAAAIPEREYGVKTLRGRAREISARADALEVCPVDEE